MQQLEPVSEAIWSISQDTYRVQTRGLISLQGTLGLFFTARTEMRSLLKLANIDVRADLDKLNKKKSCTTLFMLKDHSGQYFIKSL